MTVTSTKPSHGVRDLTLLFFLLPEYSEKGHSTEKQASSYQKAATDQLCHENYNVSLRVMDECKVYGWMQRYRYVMTDNKYVIL